jgi:hypothetical protein
VFAKLWVGLTLRGCRELGGFGETALPSAILQLSLLCQIIENTELYIVYVKRNTNYCNAVYVIMVNNVNVEEIFANVFDDLLICGYCIRET